MTTDMITTAEVAARLGITPRRVLALIKANKLPAQRIGRDWLINSDDLSLVAERPAGYPKGKPRRPVSASE